jgi:hypothetical protein
MSRNAKVLRRLCAIPLAGFLLTIGSSLSTAVSRAQQTDQPAGDSGSTATRCDLSVSASPYIPVDSWIYPAVLRLYSLGLLDHAYLGLRPWTRASLSHMLKDTGSNIENAKQGPGTDEARELYTALNHELGLDAGLPCQNSARGVRLESSYTGSRAMSGTPLRDSFHLGSTIVNDYGRPYANGFNNSSGASGYATASRFTLYLRGEFQGAPSTTGYSAALAIALSAVDETAFLNPASGLPYSQTTIPMGPIATASQGRFLEAYVSAQYLNHVFFFRQTG